MAYPNSGIIGARQESEATPRYAVGTRITATDGQVWVYCLASAAIAAYAVVAIDKSHNATSLTVALAPTALSIGVAQFAIASGEYGFVAVHGHGLYALIDGTTDVNPGMVLAPSNLAAGLLAQNSASGQYMVAGLKTVTTASGTTVTTEVVLNHPHIILRDSL